MDGVDFLLHPSALTTAPLLSSYTSASSSSASTSRDPYTQDLLSLPASLAGLPALSLPAGRCVEDGWPVGMTLVGQWGGDEAVLRVAEAVEGAMKRRKQGEKA
jgi:aspartyl-tRNA(Asn)/glutamyl-tRNA(Gln) amidotransferase subunit A